MSPIELPLSSSFFNEIVNYYKRCLMFLCPFFSILTSKRCEKEKMTVHEKHNKKKKKWWSFGSSCFGDSGMYNPDGSFEVVKIPVRKRVLSRFVRKKKTVPIEIAVNEMDCEIKSRSSDGKKEDDRHSKPEESPNEIETQKQPKVFSSSNSVCDDSIFTEKYLSSKNDYVPKSGPLCRSLDRVGTPTQLRTSNSYSSSPVSTQYSTPESFTKEMMADEELIRETDPSKMVPVITVAIFLVLLLGRGFAIFSMCIYFYVASRVRSDRHSKDQRSKEIELSSRYHKQMVVRRGFLQRGKNKLASNS